MSVLFEEHTASADSVHPAPAVVCIGETMAVLAAVDTKPLAQQTVLTVGVGGAESNVARALAALGHRVAWVGRVGADPLGQRILHELAADGVDISAVEADTERPTGVYFKAPGPDRTDTFYYRRDSAASFMGPDIARLPLLRQARVLHMSGITAALSNSCAQLISEIVARRTVPGPVISFDVNYRPALWRPDAARAAQALLELARSADLVFVGRDEAEALWGIGEVEEIRDLLHGHGADVIVKDAGTGATAFSARQEVFVPAPACHVVERVGAGDAFAAGYLAALLEDRGVRTGLRLGHLVACATLGTRHDVPRVPDRDTLERHLALDDTAWSVLDLP